MADGHYRFQGGAGPFYYSQQQGHHPRHIQQRNGSPVNSGRPGGYNTDTPSPSRSPPPQSPAHGTYGMYGQGHHQGQHGMMNGTSHQRYAMGMNLHSNKFQNQASHHQNHQHHQHQEHNGHGGHGANYGSHQHSLSGSGMASAQQHFSAGNVQNGTPNSVHSGLDKPLSKHATSQLQLAQEAREMVMIHSHARNHPSVNKNVVAGASNGMSKETDKEERNRGFGDSGDSSRIKQAWTGLDLSGTRLKAISRPLFDYTFLTKLYFNCNKLTELPPALGRLRNLEELDCSLNDISEIPQEIGMLSKLKVLALVDNHVETFPFELGYLYKLETLAVEGNPLQEDLKSVLYENGTSELIKYLREQAQGPPPPNERDWIVVDTDQKSDDKITAMSFNALCDNSCTQAQFGYTPASVLAWENRREMILDEIRGRDADIVCLQEIDSSFHDFFMPALAHNGYKGVYWPRSRARTMGEREAKLVDGCATFYKSSKYILLDKQLIDFNNIAINRPDMKGEHDVFNRVMPRDHIAVLTFFENRQTGSRVIVVNAHVFWNPVYLDVKVVQVAIMMEQITKAVEKYAKWPACTDKSIFKYEEKDDEEGGTELPAPQKHAPSMTYSDGAQIPLLICGDFNSVPGSGIFDFFVHGSMASAHPDFGNRKYGNFTKEGLSHPFSIKSSYSHIGELDFTNYTPGYVEVLDYIWYSTNSLAVTGLLGNVDKEYLKRVPGFPNYHFPSDHLPLLAEFSVLPRKGKVALTEPDFGPSSQSRRG